MIQEKKSINDEDRDYMDESKYHGYSQDGDPLDPMASKAGKLDD